MILDVARALERGEVVGALELREQLLRRLAEHVHEHVEAAAMRHADHELLHAALAGPLDQIVENRNQRLAAFEREALLAHVARIQVALDALGARQAARGSQAARPS